MGEGMQGCERDCERGGGEGVRGYLQEYTDLTPQHSQLDRFQTPPHDCSDGWHFRSHGTRDQRLDD